MIILDFKGDNAENTSFLLKKMPGKGFLREDALKFTGFYEACTPGHMRFVIWNWLQPKEFMASRQRALDLEGYADPTGQCVDRYWLSQVEPCLGELLKEQQTHPIAEANLAVTIEFPAILLHHVARLQEVLTSLNWEFTITSLAHSFGFGALYDRELAAGVYSLKLTKHGKPARLYQEVHLLTCCYGQSHKYKPSESQVSKLLRLGGDWLKGSVNRDMTVGFYLQGDRQLCSHAAKLLGTTTQALLHDHKEESAVAEPFNLLSFLKDWVQNGLAPEVDFPASVPYNQRSALNGALKTMLQTQRVVNSNLTENPFNVEKDSDAFKFWETRDTMHLVNQGLAAYSQHTKGLHAERHAWIIEQLGESTAILELGANDGKCSESLFRAKRDNLQELTLVDQDEFLLLRANDRLERSGSKKHNIYISNLIYADPRWLQPRFQSHWDATVLCEVIEHLTAVQLEQTMRNLGGQLKTKKIILTTPNRSWNQFLGDHIDRRHADHQFEWTLEEATAWAATFSARYNLTYTVAPIGRELVGFGSPSIGLVFQTK